MTENFSRIHFSSISYNWDSPMDIFNELHEEFKFTLDPTDRPIAGLPGLEDGLRMPYGTKENPSRIYDNPAYGRGLIDAKIAHCIREMRFGHVELAVYLIPLRNSDYFKRLRKHGAEIRLCEKRLKFGDADDSSKNKDDNGAPFDSCVAILKNPFEKFLPEITNKSL